MNRNNHNTFKDIVYVYSPIAKTSIVMIERRPIRWEIWLVPFEFMMSLREKTKIFRFFFIRTFQFDARAVEARTLYGRREIVSWVSAFY